MVTILAVPTRGRANDGDDALPPPPDARSINQQAVYHLGLIVNQAEASLVVPVTRRGNDFFVSAADLQRAGIPGDKLPGAEVNVSQWPPVHTEYDSTRQRLVLTVPDGWLPASRIALSNAQAAVTPRNSSGALLNYDIYTSHTQSGTSQASAWHELRFFGDAGSLSTTGTARQGFSGPRGINNGYRRYDTTFVASNEANATRWSAGDVISDALAWSSSVRMGGVSWGRDFSIRPDLITYPLPAFSGEAAVPSTVDVFINGYRSGSTRLQPGPFTLTNLPYINGSGDAVLVTTDALGRQVSTTLPFYVAADLLKAGLTDGSVTLGALRRRYGERDFDYGPAAGSGSLRHGVTDYWTVESHVEGADSLALGGLGSMVKLGHFGVVNGAWSHSQMRGEQGQQINWGYQYSGERINVSTQHSHRDRGFGNLALYDRPSMFDINNPPIATLSRTTDQYAMSVNLSQYGNVGAAWIDVGSFEGEHTRLMNISWSKNLWWNSSFYIAGSRDPDRDGWALAMSLQIPFGTLESVALSVDRTRDNGSIARVDYSHTMPSDGGFSWDLAYARQSRSDDYQQATLGWRNNALETHGGVYGEPGQYTQWAQLNGALVAMDNSLFAANQINDAFALISTDGQPDVTVDFENQPIGQTDEDGYLLVSGVSSWYPANYSINALNLAADTRIRDTERRVAIRRQSGYLIEFPIAHERVASVILHDAAGQPIPVSSQVFRDGLPPEIVGYDGIAWLPNISDSNLLRVEMPDGQRCTVRFDARANPNHQLITYGPEVCRPERR